MQRANLYTRGGAIRYIITGMHEAPSHQKQDASTVVFFDGVCNLCNGFVDFLIRHDSHSVLHFASLQSPWGQAKRARVGDSGADPESIVLRHHGNTYVRSGAAIRTIALLGGGWRLYRALLVIPSPIRDIAYRVVARYRYPWFGRRDTCRVPSPAERSRFLEG